MIKQRIEVHSQAELDACVKDGNIAIIVCEEWVEARGSSHVVARGSSHVEAWESSHVVARESSHVEAWGNAFVRLFSALKLKASANVMVMIHGERRGEVEGGVQRQAFVPKTGEDWCEYFAIDPAAAPFAVPQIDLKILDAIESGKAKGLDMGSWHGDEEVNETNWCGTTHCRAGYAICLAGKPGFELERKYGSETAGQMIYAASRQSEPLPDFHASNAQAMADIRASAERQRAATPTTTEK